MKIDYKNQRLEHFLAAVNAITATIVAGTFVLLVGFDKPFISAAILHKIQAWALMVFILEKPIRMLNAVSRRQWFRSSQVEVVQVLVLVFVLVGAGRLFAMQHPRAIRELAIGAYLFVQLVTKGSVGIVNVMAAGKSPTRVLVMSFIGVILAGTAMLMMPRATVGEKMNLVDAIFTATSATCVTGLTVQDTGTFFTHQGQMTILALIQLGGLGIVLFGAVFALIVGQAFSVRETAAMRQVLSEEGAIKIGGMIGFIFVFTVFIEVLGALLLYPMWHNTENTRQQWFLSVFHSVSAFCNAGFSVFTDNMMAYRRSPGLYLVICPLIILGGLGFGVLRNITEIVLQIFKSYWIKLRTGHRPAHIQTSRLTLHSKIVLTCSALLIVGGMIAMVVLEKYSVRPTLPQEDIDFTWYDGLFHSVSARTAGFNTVDIQSMSPAGKAVLMILMVIGGSPGSTAGGIKTVTFVMLFLVVWVTLRKRTEVEIFGRAIRLVIVSRAIALAVMYVLTIVVMTIALTITERHSGFTLQDVAFEATSALGTVGLSTGITAKLSTAGKLIITLAMLIGRLGPLTLIASLTFNLRPVRYNYPEEPVMVG